MINTLVFSGLRLKSISLHMFLRENISADNCTRELFKPLKDLKSHCVCNEQKFGFRVFCECHHKWTCFRHFDPLHLALSPNR